MPLDTIFKKGYFFMLAFIVMWSILFAKNVSSQSPPYSFQQWLKKTPKRSQSLVSLWLDAGELPKHPTSTVIDTTLNELTVLRQGSMQIDGIFHEYTTRNEDETHQLSQHLAKNYLTDISNHGLVIGLQGELGAGKTQFCKGIALALGINQTITSPTFALINEYVIPTKNLKLKTYNYFYHIDTWRMEQPHELKALGFENMLKPGNIITIEWVEKTIDLIKKLLHKYQTKLILINVEVIDQYTRKWQISQPNQ